MTDFQLQPQEQIGFLDASCASYDSGNQSEALRLAVTIRVLVHDTSNSTSLLQHLNVKESIRFIDGSGPGFDRLPSIGDNPTTSSCTLVSLAHFADRVEYYPAFVTGIDPDKTVPFETWWKTYISHDSQNNRMFRRHFVLALAHKEGGAHIDPHLDPEYKAISKDGSMGWLQDGGSIVFSKDPDAPKTPISPVPAAVRHIAEEVRMSLRQALPDLLGDLAIAPPTTHRYQTPPMYTSGSQIQW